MCSCCRLDELGADANLLTGAADATLQDVADPKVTRYLAHIDGTALVDKGGISRDHGKGTEAAERRSQVFDYPIGDEMFSLKNLKP